MQRKNIKPPGPDINYLLRTARGYAVAFLPAALIAVSRAQIPDSTEPVLTNNVLEAPVFSFTNPPVISPRLSGAGQLASPPQLPPANATSLLQWGPVTFRPHPFYSFSYANGLQTAPGERVNTTINEIDPGVLFQLGDHWTLDYTPILRYYSSSSFRDTFDNQVVLAGQTTYKDWTFGLSQSYLSSSQPMVETAGQLDTQTYLTALNAVDRINTVLTLELNASQSLQFVDQSVPGEQLSDWYNWSTMDWLNYQILPGLGAALGFGFHYDHMSASPDMTAELYQGRLTWHPGQKLNVVLSGGLQDRQFLNSDEPDNLSPIFNLTGEYQIFAPTRLFVTGARTVSPSYFAGQITESTIISGGINQRFLGNFFVNLTGGYGKTSYQTTGAAVSPSFASDFDTTFFNASVTTTFLRRATVSVFYQLTYYLSSSAIYNYDTYQVGVSLGYRF